MVQKKEPSEEGSNYISYITNTSLQLSQAPKKVRIICILVIHYAANLNLNCHKKKRNHLFLQFSIDPSHQGQNFRLVIGRFQRYAERPLHNLILLLSSCLYMPGLYFRFSGMHWIDCSKLRPIRDLSRLPY